jgi:hypothetical protein
MRVVRVTDCGFLQAAEMMGWRINQHGKGESRAKLGILLPSELMGADRLKTRATMKDTTKFWLGSLFFSFEMGGGGGEGGAVLFLDEPLLV